MAIDKNRDFHLSLKYHEEKVAQELKQRLGKKRDACIMLHQNLKCLLTRGVTYRHHEQLPQWPQLMDRLACRLRRENCEYEEKREENSLGSLASRKNRDATLKVSGNQKNLLSRDTETPKRQGHGESQAKEYKPAERLLHDLLSGHNEYQPEDQIMHDVCSIANEEGSRNLQPALHSQGQALALKLKHRFQRSRDECIFGRQRLKCLLAIPVPDTQREQLAQWCQWAAHLACRLDKARPHQDTQHL
ncbi:uncharacterized protein LOC134471844 [Cavia porcellus]|uniref:uncharacterized protein LOC134471844 n=1 Tax=Cavia porcellus TaxID=10141 RepID=UPI002FE306AF